MVPKLNLRLGRFFVDKKTGRYVCVRICIYIHYMYGICIDMTLDMEILRYDMMRNISA